jgi:hypothetical protein
VQEYLWRCWQDFVSHCPPLDVLLVVGDVVEGTVQLRAAPRGNASDDAMDQIDACEATLAPLCAKTQKTFLIAGTPFHDSHGERMEDLGRRLKTEAWASGGRYSGQVLNLQWRGLRINASHHMTRGWVWLAGAASRTAVLAAAAEAAEKLPGADIIVRGDLHTKVLARTLNKWVCFLPGWTMPTPHAVRKMEAVRAYLATDIGAVVMEYDGETIGWRSFEYPLAKQSVVRA